MGALLAGVAVGLLAKPTLAGPSPTPPGVDVGLKAPRRVESPVPKYPKDARRAGLAGLVVLECTVDRRGQVVKAEVRDGVPPLTDAAVEAVKQWRYEPALLDGVPVTATITVKVRFLPEELRYDGLLGSLRHRNEHIREAAARWLGQLHVGGALGEEDVQETARALQRLVEGDESPWVRATAARSLEHLVGPPLPPAAPPADMFDTPRDVSWGVFVDPALQCDFVDRGDWIEIGVPAGPYDLNIENGQMAAPRVLQPVEGDLVAQVTVAQLAEPAPPAAGPPRGDFHGAGLLLWQDDRNYVRIESAASRADGRPVRYALFKVWRDGKAVGGLSRAPLLLRDAPTELRLERHDRELRALVRQGDDAWREAGRVEVHLRRRLEVGVAAVNDSGSGLRAILTGFALNAQPGTTPRPANRAAGSPAGVARDAPPQVLSMTRPTYPREAHDKRIQGIVMVEILIDTEGRVARSRVIQSVPELDAAALAGVEAWRFKPAIRGGTPVPATARAPIVFRLE